MKKTLLILCLFVAVVAIAQQCVIGFQPHSVKTVAQQSFLNQTGASVAPVTLFTPIVDGDFQLNISIDGSGNTTSWGNGSPLDRAVLLDWVTDTSPVRMGECLANVSYHAVFSGTVIIGTAATSIPFHAKAGTPIILAFGPDDSNHPGINGCDNTGGIGTTRFPLQVNYNIFATLQQF